MESIDGAGAHLICCKATGRVYVGSSSVSVMTRKNHHWWLLKSGRHKSSRMQQDFDSYGESEFEFNVVAWINDGSSVHAEQALIEKYDATNPEKGYNVAKVAFKGAGRPKKAAKMKVIQITITITRDRLAKVDARGGTTECVHLKATGEQYFILKEVRV